MIDASGNRDRNDKPPGRTRVASATGSSEVRYERTIPMATPTLRIRLLGGLDLRYDGVSLPPLESARAASLLAYLLLHREAPQLRQNLAFLLWPDSTEPQARTNLRHVLHRLRHTLPDADRYLEITQRSLRWRPEAPTCFYGFARRPYD